MITYTPSPHYTIREAATLSGLSESALRYYEEIGLLPPIARDASSKHRVFCEDDITRAIAVACLSATGMSLDEMRAYLRNRGLGADGADEQIGLLETQQRRLAAEYDALQVRRDYVDVKIAYWRAVREGNETQVEALRVRASAIAKRLKRSRLEDEDQRNGDDAFAHRNSEE